MRVLTPEHDTAASITVRIAGRLQ